MLICYIIPNSETFKKSGPQKSYFFYIFHVFWTARNFSRRPCNHSVPGSSAARDLCCMSGPLFSPHFLSALYCMLCDKGQRKSGQMASKSLSVSQTKALSLLNSHRVFIRITGAHGSGRKQKCKLAQSLTLALFHQ